MPTLALDLMKTIQKIILLLIAIFGIVIAYLTYSFLKGQRTYIYLFNNDYEAGTTITNDMLTTLEVDANIVDNLAASTNNATKYVTQNDLAEIISKGDTLGTDVYALTPFMTSETSTIGGSVVERRLSDYKTAITLPVDNISGVSPEITAGAKINIYSSYSTENFQVVKLLFQNVKILDVQATGDKDSGYTLSAITIEIPPEDVLVLQHAIKFNNISISLLKSGKYETLSDSRTTYKVNQMLLETLLQQQ